MANFLFFAGVDLGAVRFHASLNLPLLEPERWATDFSVQVEAESHHESLGLFSGTSVLVTLAPQISAYLHLPSLPTLPWVTVAVVHGILIRRLKSIFFLRRHRNKSVANDPWFDA